MKYTFLRNASEITRLTLRQAQGEERFKPHAELVEASLLSIVISQAFLTVKIK
jgi:hypothetical protein